MNIAILGTGIVGRTLAEGLDRAGHTVAIGTRDPQATMARTDRDAMGNPPYSAWQTDHAGIQLQPYQQAASAADLVVNATSGTGSLAALSECGPTNLAGKIIMDVANPLDFSGGMPPVLSVVNTDSLAEQIQRAHPDAKVVKTLNTVTARLMIKPARVPGEHTIFVCGDDGGAKESVTALLQELGWPRTSIMDLGGIGAARGLEMYLPLWLTMMMTMGTPDFNIRVVRD